MNNRFLRNGRSGALKAAFDAALLVLVTSATGIFSLSASAQTPGTLDSTFIKGAGADGFIRAVTVQPDSKILVGGNFASIRNSTNPMVARLNSDGSSDSTFASPFPTPVLASRVYAIGVQDDGRILLGGLFTNLLGAFRTNIARVETNGTVDQTFDAQGGPSGLVRVLAIQPDQKAVIGGEFTEVNGISRNRVARLNSNGTLDTSFDPASGASDIVRAVALLPGGQVLVGGLFTTFAGAAKPYLARLDSNGSIDSTFPAGTGPNNNVYFISVQADGTILITGDFTAVNGVTANRVARLFPDGSLDSSFSPNGGVLGGPVYQVLTQPNGRLVIGGGFTSVNGAPLNGLARLNSDGTLDATFLPGSGPSDMVLSMALQSDGMILAGGLFATYAGVSVNMVARVYGDPVNPLLSVEALGTGQFALAWPASAAAFTLQSRDALNLGTWQNVTTPPVLQGNRLVLTPNTDSPSKFYRLVR